MQSVGSIPDRRAIKFSAEEGPFGFCFRWPSRRVEILLWKERRTPFAPRVGVPRSVEIPRRI